MKLTDFEDIIDRCRLTFGAPGKRKFGLRDRLCYLPLWRPTWCHQGDGLWQTLEYQWQIFKEGRIVWAHIVQANVDLFEPGTKDCPASIVFCPDDSVNVGVDVLSYAARSLFALKGTFPKDPELLDIAKKVTDEYSRTFGLLVPKRLSSGYELYEATTFIARKHLPNQMLTGSFFPLLVTCRKPYYSLPLPARYWPKQFVDAWCRQAI